MQPPRPEKVDIALLYEDYKPFTYMQLVERLQLIFGEKIPVGLGQFEEGVWGVIKVGGVCAIVSQNSGPLAPDGFSSALASPYNARLFPDAPRLVQAHRKNIFITVGSTDILTSGIRESDVARKIAEMTGEDMFAPKTPSKEMFADWLLVARTLCNQVMQISRPSLVHWCQSDQLLSPDQMDLMDDLRGMRLHIHPSLYSSGNDASGRQLIGYHAFGSEHLTGHHVIVQETALDLEEVRFAVDDFIYSLTTSDVPPLDGQVIRMKSGAELKVHLKGPDKTYPRKYLSIEVLAIGNRVAQAAQESKAQKQALAKMVQDAKTPKQKKKLPSFKTLRNQGMIALLVIIVLGIPLGALVLAGWFMWSKYKGAKNASLA